MMVVPASAHANVGEDHRRRERSVLHRRERDLRELAELYRAALGGRPCAELLGEFCDLILGTLGTDAVWIHLRPDHTAPYRLVASSGLDAAAQADLADLRVGVGASGRALLGPNSVTGRERDLIVAAAAVPGYGVVTTATTDPRRRFAGEELAILETLAAHMGIAVEVACGAH